ncbi:UNVERIFIED_ORG: hypothetical protein ABIC62_003333 [Burkholderia sp. 1595]|uniref:Uncharacterized protein n=1 Tax=Paraburkholderia terricola TaxID=169427 RepID=A0ABU1LQN5_9BURK|nr:hypothetical protein [Paraburkholderia terricola]MDR6482075.1 hypothetical protein [Paraburkholderia terricola]
MWKFIWIATRARSMSRTSNNALPSGTADEPPPHGLSYYDKQAYEQLSRIVATHIVTAMAKTYPQPLGARRPSLGFLAQSATE